MLFREQLTNDKDEIESEEFMKQSLEEWKKLGPSEKKEWNMKAKGEKDMNKTQSEIDNNNEINDKITIEESVKNYNNESKELKEKNNSANAKSKLAMFAFAKK